jgi:hypothetical protein
LKKKSKFVICAIFGGLGNQVLQYFFAKSLAKKLNCELILDISWGEVKFPYSQYLKKNANKFVLDSFSIKSVKLEKNIFKLNYKYILYLRHFHKKIIIFLCKYLFSYPVDNFFYENTFNEINKKIDFKNFSINCYYFGYWQKILKNNNFDESLKKDFFLTKRKKISKIIKKINNKTIAVHIRGGDYLLKKNNFYNVIDFNYFFKCIKFYKRKIKNPVFHIFTDDKVYASKILNNINIDFKRVFIYKFGLSDLEEFELLRNYSSYIISNSTFSLVPCFLSYKSKTILAPKFWFINHKNTLLKKSKNVLFM